MWQCPICHEPFASDATTTPWQCANNHSFDRAKQGYFNLLPVQNKKTKSPGDDAGMVNARSAFFETKPYTPLAVTIAEIIKQVDDEKNHKNNTFSVPRNPRETVNVYDSGCGEGFYIELVSELLGDGYSLSGHDISKPAIVSASKRNRQTQTVVASTINIPVTSESQDFIYQVFAPSCADEYHRILKKDGRLITVEPAQNHLIELKRYIYDEPKLHQCERQELHGFELQDTKEVSFSVLLDQVEQRQALLQMTPFFWKATEQAKRRISEELKEVTASFFIQVYKRSAISDAADVVGKVGQGDDE